MSFFWFHVYLAARVQVLKERIAWLEATNEHLYRELHEYRSRCAFVERCEIDEPAVCESENL